MYFTFNGIKSGDMGAYILKQPPLIAAARRVVEVHTYGRNYRTMRDYGAIPYIMYLDMAVEDIRDIDRIKGWLQGRGYFTRSDFPGKRLLVEIQSDLVFEMISTNLYKCNLGIWVQYPFWIGESDAWVSAMPTVENIGTYRSLPQYRITGTAGTRTEVTIGEDKFAYRFPEDESVVILDTREKTVTNERGVSRILHIEIGYNFPELQPGITNVSATEGATVQVRRKDTWI